MYIHTHFIGGNIAVEKTENNIVYVERELRDTTGDWFYWAFCVENAAGETITFRFPSACRVGRFGPAVSYDLENWHWLDRPCTGDSFTYTFGSNENRVYFAHNMLYPLGRFTDLCSRYGLTMETLCTTSKGRNLPGIRFGTGERWILLAARHHACESTGSYVLEGVVETLLQKLPAEYSVLVVPYVDYDGVLDGDQGKNRIPHDQNRDYTDEPIYDAVAYMMQFGRTHTVTHATDFHSPWHQGQENDHVFLYPGTMDMSDLVHRFTSLLREETAEIQIRYTGAYDGQPLRHWKDALSPCFKNYFCSLESILMSMTLETPYFGLEETKVSQAELLAFGNAFGRALLQVL